MVDFEIFDAIAENKVDVSFSNGREWGVYYNPTENYEYIEADCEKCHEKKGGYVRNISVQITEIMNSNIMVPVRKITNALQEQLVAEIEEFLIAEDEFVCCECIEKE